jgi:cell wall-associated NlpC family hydrolase
MSADPRRAAVIAEATSWLDTPFHHAGRLKGIGVDCGQLLIAVYGACGFVPLDYTVAHYPPDFAVHGDRERYLEGIAEFARAVEIPGPGDAVVFKLGRVFWHGGIVVAWPGIIHAMRSVGKVKFVNVDKDWELNQVTRRVFFSPFEDR